MNRVNIVVKYRDEVRLPADGGQAQLSESDAVKWRALQREFPGRLTLRRLFHQIDTGLIKELILIAQEQAGKIRGRAYNAPKFENFLWATYQAKSNAPRDMETALLEASDSLVPKIRGWGEQIEYCYVRLGDRNPGLLLAAQPIMFGPGDIEAPETTHQEHLLAAPKGVGAVAVGNNAGAPGIWAYEGGDGAGQSFVDLERGWNLNHADLLDSLSSQPRVIFDASNGGEQSIDPLIRQHGTRVLGVVCATRNQVGKIGLAPGLASMETISHLSKKDVTSTAHAVLKTAAKRIAKLIKAERAAQLSALRSTTLLLEVEASLPGQQYSFPVEIYPDTFAAIQLATLAGISIIEPAGNGWFGLSDNDVALAVNFDAMNQFIKAKTGLPPLLRSLNPQSTDAGKLLAGHVKLESFEDSGAIMVGAATHAVANSDDWTRHINSNYGARIDCFAAGDDVSTLDYSDAIPNGYTQVFDGTSSASAIIAGAALCLKGVAKANGIALEAFQVRKILSDRNLGTKIFGGATNEIGVMPNLAAILADAFNTWAKPVP